jgi:hypothetical protein
MTHNERVTMFLSARGLTMTAACLLPTDERKALDTAFRAEKRIREQSSYAGSIKLSRRELKALLPVGTELVLVYAMGEPINKPRTVAEHRSYGLEMRTADGRLSSLRHEAGESILALQTNDNILITILDVEKHMVVQYHIPCTPLAANWSPKSARQSVGGTVGT